MFWFRSDAPIEYVLKRLGIFVLCIIAAVTLVMLGKRSSVNGKLSAADEIIVLYGGNAAEIKEVSEIVGIFKKLKAVGAYGGYEYAPEYQMIFADDQNNNNSLSYFFAVGKNNVFMVNDPYSENEWYEIPETSGKELEKILGRYGIELP